MLVYSHWGTHCSYSVFNRYLANVLFTFGIHINIINHIFRLNRIMYLHDFRTAIVRVTDQRIKRMCEIIKSMGIIKMYCWESAFTQMIENIRK